MHTTKITLVGAGSTSFGLSTVQDIIACASDLRGSTIVLADIDTGSVDLMLKVAQAMNEAAGSNLCFEGSTDIRAALAGAEYVITSVAVDRNATWQRDWQIPFKYGVKHVLGENGGPGGLGHTLRSVRVMLDVARTIQEVAPQAFVLNFTNPLTRICLALARATQLRFVGLCHGIGIGYRTVGKVLGLTNDGQDPYEQRELLHHKLDIKAAGLNHFTFIYDIRDAETGADLYPLFLERLDELPEDFEPLSRRMLYAFGLFPAIGDGHTGEYISYAWETSSLKGYDFKAAEKRSAEKKAMLRQVVSGERSIDPLLGKTSGERAIQIIAALLHNKNQYELAVNIPNRGCIPGLPDWAIVEVPAVVSAAGINGLQIPPFPPGITAILNQQVAVQDRAVEAAIHGDRQAALQALLLDPVVHSYSAANQILDELLEVHAEYLPQFSQSAKKEA